MIPERHGLTGSTNDLCSHLLCSGTSTPQMNSHFILSFLGHLYMTGQKYHDSSDSDLCPYFSLSRPLPPHEKICTTFPTRRRDTTIVFLQSLTRCTSRSFSDKGLLLGLASRRSILRSTTKLNFSLFFVQKNHIHIGFITYSI